jgi:hypothetical protein
LTLLRKINCESRIETGFATLFWLSCGKW